MSAGAVLLTRPEPESREIAAALAPVPVLIWPLTRIEYLAAELPAAAALVFTSRHGVAGYFAAGGDTGLPAFCVGPATRAAAAAAGLGPCTDAGGQAGRLAGMVAAAGHRRALYPRGAEVARDLPRAFAEHGLALDEAVVYRADETGDPPPEGGIGLVTVWSPRAAGILARRLGGAPSQPVLAISEAAAAPLRAAGFGAVAVARRPDRAAMLAAIREHHDRNGGTV